MWKPAASWTFIRPAPAIEFAPVVALVRTGFSLQPEAGEVAEIFEVPLGFLMDPANHQRHGREWQGKKRWFYAMPYDRHYIWGATAGMLRNFYDRVYAPGALPGAHATQDV